MIKLPGFSFRVELTELFLRALVDQLNKLVVRLDQVTGYDARIATTSFTLLPGYQHKAVLVNSSAGSVTITLPLASESGNMRVEAKHYIGGNSMIIARQGADTIDGGTSVSTATTNQSFTVVAIEGAWYVI